MVRSAMQRLTSRSTSLSTDAVMKQLMISHGHAHLYLLRPLRDPRYLWRHVPGMPILVS